jgi:hypothetical protein
MVEPIYPNTIHDALAGLQISIMVAALIGVAWFGAAIVVVGRLMQ